MSGSQPTNNAAVDFEKEQAAEADAKEAQRQQQQRLTRRDSRRSLSRFSPARRKPLTTTKFPFDWSTFKPSSVNYLTNSFTPASGVPEGYTAVQVPGAATNAPKYDQTYDASGKLLTARGVAPGTATPGASTWGLQDASGKTYKQGDTFNVTTQTPTGKMVGGFDDDFYNAYKQKVLDYYEPDEQRQYDAAQRDLTYSLARAGTLQSRHCGRQARWRAGLRRLFAEGERHCRQRQYARGQPQEPDPVD